MELYKKYRPRTLDELYGNKKVVESLKSKLKNKNLPHAILLTGNSGCGKTSIARILKNELGCSDFDYTEMDSAQFRGIDSVRALTARFPYKPTKGNCKVVLIDEVGLLGAGGASVKNIPQTALLKALEDVPPHIYLVLATTNPEMLLKTIRNRCSVFKVEALSNKDMYKLLTDVCDKENVEVDEECIEKIIDNAEGSSRKALVYLDSIIDLEPDEMLETLQVTNEESAEVIELCRLLMGNASWGKISKVLKLLLKDNEPEALRRVVLGYFSSVLLNSGNDIAFDIIDAFSDNYFDNGKAGLVASCFEVCNLK